VQGRQRIRVFARSVALASAPDLAGSAALLGLAWKKHSAPSVAADRQRLPLLVWALQRGSGFLWVMFGLNASL
jgi:hypothetical protein